MSADDLKAKAIGALRRLQKLPDIVRGFLRDPKLAYILELHKRTAREVYKLISSLVAPRERGPSEQRSIAARREGELDQCQPNLDGEFTLAPEEVQH